MGRIHSVMSARVAQIALVVLLAVAAIMLADAEGGRQIADDAAVQRAAESVLSAAAVTEAASQQAVVAARAWEEGVADREEVEAAAASLWRRIDELDTRVETLVSLAEDPEPVRSAHFDYRGQVVRIADGLTSGEIATIHAETDPSPYASLAGVASRIRDERQVHIITVRRGVETVSAAARLFVGLGLPALILLLLYRGLRQRQRQVIVEEELRRERALRRAKDRFLNGASHHLNTPMAAVLGFAQLLNDSHRKFTAAERSELIELLAMQAEEASHVAEDLLVAARSDMTDLALQSVEVNLREAIESAVQGWEGSELARLEIKGNAVAFGDPYRVIQVLRNLLRNALAFGGAHITVVIAAGPDAVVSVSDDGLGIPAGFEDKVFQPYYTRKGTDAFPSAMGLGLSVARRLARVMGGDLTYERRNSSSVFTLTLPLAPDASVPTATDVIIDPAATRPTPADIADLLTDGGPPIIYQPIVRIKAHETGEQAVVGYEGLARFPFASTEDWFRVARISGRRLDLELRCVDTAIRGFHPESDEQFLTLNLSDETLSSSRLITALAEAPAERVVLELSETATIKNYEKTKRNLDRLRRRGVRLAIDDFGAAEIDLWHIVRLEASVVKLDMSLVTDLEHSPSSRGFVRALLAMAEELNFVLIAEGVETEREHRALLELDVPFGQGFFYARPQPLDVWTSWEVVSER